MIVTGVVEALDGRILDGAVHPLDLSVGPRMARLWRSMVNVVGGTSELTPKSPDAFAVGERIELLEAQALPPIHNPIGSPNNPRHSLRPSRRCHDLAQRNVDPP